jgi:polar amino acid transport system substrate-binding protein
MAALLVFISCAPAAPSQPKKLTVACDATWPPFELVNEQTREVDGYGIDLMKAIAQKAGLDIRFVNVNFDTLIAGIARCQYDMAVSSITITEERKKEILFSDPYFAAGQIVSVQKDNADIKGKDDLAGKTAGAQIGTTGAIEIGKMPGVKLKTYDDVGLAFQDLMNGQIDAVVSDYPVAVGYVVKNPKQLKNVGTMFTDENYGIAICRNNPHLVPVINAALKALKDEGYLNKLNNKWILGK